MTSALDRALIDAQIDVWTAQLTAARRLQNLSQRELAALIGTTQARVGAWETDSCAREQPTLRSLMLWAGALKFSLLMVPAEPINPKEQ